MLTAVIIVNQERITTLLLKSSAVKITVGLQIGVKMEMATFTIAALTRCRNLLRYFILKSYENYRT
jgi:hypothetical protein